MLRNIDAMGSLGNHCVPEVLSVSTAEELSKNA